MPEHVPEQPGVADPPRRLTRSPLEETTDGDLLARHVEGDAAAFSELVRRHRDRLWAVALRTLGDPDEAADAVQDALISAFRAAHTYRGQASVTTWLYRVVVNACLDRVRRRAAHPVVPLPDEDNLSREASRVRSRETGVPHDDPVERLETRLEVARALAALPVEQRAALILVDMQGFSVDDAAQVLGVAPGTVKSRCSRGRARLLPLVTHLRPDRGSRRRGDRAPEAARNPSGGAHVQPQAGQVAAEGGESAP
ncbi:MAG: RNA polymerase sigma factor SigM [Carbonactinosporaceae bacterium]